MLYAGLDIHTSVFQAVVLDADSGELSESRFQPTHTELGNWASEWQGKLVARRVRKFGRAGLQGNRESAVSSISAAIAERGR
jgi:sugar (pentulose or hexulose) kinase